MNAVAEPTCGRSVQRPVERGRGLWGIGLFIATEGMLFALLLFAYFFLGATNQSWPPAEDPAYELALILLGILLASSLTAAWGESGIKRDRPGRLKVGLTLTLLLGVAFLAVQTLEFRVHLASLTPQESAYGSIFYTITTLHLAHVIVGLLLLAFALARALAGHFSKDRHVGVTTTVMYWHFVDVVWIVVVCALYLSPHFYGP